MHPWGPPFACGYRRRKKNTTLEEHWPTTDSHTNVTGGTTHVATNLKSYFTNNTHGHKKTAWTTSKATGGTDTNMLQLGIVILVVVVAGPIQNPLGDFVHNQPNLIQASRPSACIPTQQHQKLCQKYTRITKIPNYATNVCSLLRWRIRSPSTSKVPPAKSGSK
jgi:hypothetical protein